ncbi:Sialic acid-binding Ig-like lectin 11 [Tupaia chinensis]|uniref:Sialic acid-binding Ig-like lectin 11 n=1 Tax=Tupaia chinensis TaxID=246437 RepID=L9L330_TUPCH|nr:Sialic acid-binding Ig-like lectin 11 [Tupaia chinensis]
MRLLPPLLLPLLWAGSLAQDSQYQLKVPPLVEVQEGLCVLVPCRVSYPGHCRTVCDSPAYGYWFREKASINQDAPVATNEQSREVQEGSRGRFLLSGDPQTCNCSLDIRDAQRGDAGAYFFRVERGPEVRYSFTENLLSVRVTDLTQTPDVHIWGTLESGRPQNITCAVPWACKRGTPPTFSWIGVALSSLVPQTPLSSVLTLTPGPQHHGTNLTCRVTLPGSGVTTERTIQLNVSYAPENLTIRVFRSNGTGSEALHNGSTFWVQDGQSLSLVCFAVSNPPAKLTWARGNLILTPSQPSNPGVLELPQVELGDHGKYTCQAQHPLGTQKASVSLLAKRSEALHNGSTFWVQDGQSLSLVCFAVSNPPAKLTWARGNLILTPSQPSNPGVLELPQVELGDHGKYTCQAQHPLGTQKASVSLLAKKPRCSSRACPAPSLHWRLGEQLLEGNSSDASFTVTYSSAGPWANGCSDLRLSCEARNAHGAQSLVVLLLPEKPGSRTGVVLGAVGGAGVMALVAVCLCLTFLTCVVASVKGRLLWPWSLHWAALLASLTVSQPGSEALLPSHRVKSYSQKSATKAGSGDGARPVMRTISQGHLNASCSDSPSDHLPPATATPISGQGQGQEQELHYASLSFHRLKAEDSQDREAIDSTEYSAIKVRK